MRVAMIDNETSMENTDREELLQELQELSRSHERLLGTNSDIFIRSQGLSQGQTKSLIDRIQQHSLRRILGVNASLRAIRATNGNFVILTNRPEHLQYNSQSNPVILTQIPPLSLNFLVRRSEFVSVVSWQL